MFSQEPYVMFDKDFIVRKDIDNKLLLVMAYLRFKASTDGEVTLTIDLLVRSLGYVPNTHRGKINEAIITQLKWLQFNNYIFIKGDIDKVRSKECFVIKINNQNNIFDMRFENEQGKYQDKPFVILTQSEFNLMTQNNNETKTDKGILVRVYLNIKKKIFLNSVGAHLAYCSHNSLCRQCNISTTGTVNNAIKELVKMKLIYEHVTGSYIDQQGNVRNANNVYALEENEMNHKYCDEVMKEYIREEKGIDIDNFLPVASKKVKQKVNKVDNLNYIDFDESTSQQRDMDFENYINEDEEFQKILKEIDIEDIFGSNDNLPA